MDPSAIQSFSVCDKKNPWNCCSSSNPCGENEGDCDNDNDCLGNLKCGHGNGLEDNCDNSFAEGADCCFDPNLSYNTTSTPSTTSDYYDDSDYSGPNYSGDSQEYEYHDVP